MPNVTEPTSPPDESIDSVVCRTARFDTTWPGSNTAVVAGHGELDATNGIDFVHYTLRHVDKSQCLVVDLSDLSFFSTAGFSALHTLNVKCVGEDIRWAMVPGKAVKRVLRICDPDSVLPICADVPTAMTAVHDDPPQSFHLVAQPR